LLKTFLNLKEMKNFYPSEDIIKQIVYMDDKQRFNLTEVD
jgi:RNA:NAD 2'-phosphotransferase (TPT1/KptA family)